MKQRMRFATLYNLTTAGKVNENSPEAVRANCSSADSVLGISSLEAALARRSKEHADLSNAAIAFSVSDLKSAGGGVDEIDTFCVF